MFVSESKIPLGSASTPDSNPGWAPWGIHLRLLHPSFIFSLYLFIQILLILTAHGICYERTHISSRRVYFGQWLPFHNKVLVFGCQKALPRSAAGTNQGQGLMCWHPVCWFLDLLPPHHHAAYSWAPVGAASLQYPLAPLA